MKIYRLTPFAHVVCIGMSIAIALTAIGSFFDRNLKGGLAVHLEVASVGMTFSLIVMALYLTSVVNRYEVTEHGLRVHRFFRTTFHPWPAITRISWSRGLHTIFVYGSKRMIFYSSTDCFPELREFLQILHQRSGCDLSPALARALGSRKDV